MTKSTPRVNCTARKEGCAPTVRTLFDAEEAPLLRYAFSLVGRRAVAEDIVQEAFLQLHIHWDDIESPRAWLFRSVRNRVYNYVRDNRREVLSSDNGDTQSQGVHDESPDAMMLRIEASGSLNQMLEELDEDDRQLVKLKYFDGLKYREISEATGLSISNVGYRLHHILNDLAAKLRPLGFEKIS
ncbi:RNA polymerase sigma factor [Novipirellula aureliae]|nr:RNA polymerase sigma factor [Novipirellula aureliae]